MTSGSDLIKNPAVGSTTQRQMYEASPNPANMALGLGTAALPLLKAKGGSIKPKKATGLASGLLRKITKG
jgi:hypothetical protein